MGSDPLVGRVLHDTHKIVRLLGKGAMGAVYEAEHVRLAKKRFAVKVLHEQIADNPTLFKRFQQEAEIATEVGHPNIVEVMDFYHTDEGLPCMVMEYLEGEDLGVRLMREKRLAPSQVTQLASQVAGALQAVHDRKIVHRDIKPANIFLVSGEATELQVKVLDFGISKIRDSSYKLTKKKTVLGTPHFMSPEQSVGGADVDNRSDIFALGTICYLALCGEPPFDGPSINHVINAVLKSEPRLATELSPELPAEVNMVLQRAMAKKKELRYDRVEQFAHELYVALSNEPSPSLTARLKTVDAEEPAPEEDMAKTVRWNPQQAQERTAPAAAQVVVSARPGSDLSDSSNPPADPNATDILAIDDLLCDDSGATPATKAPAETVPPEAAVHRAAKEAKPALVQLQPPDPADNSSTFGATMAVVQVRRWPLMILLGVVAGLAGVGFFFYTNKQKKPVPKPILGTRTKEVRPQTIPLPTKTAVTPPGDEAKTPPGDPPLPKTAAVPPGDEAKIAPSPQPKAKANSKTVVEARPKAKKRVRRKRKARPAVARKKRPRKKKVVKKRPSKKKKKTNNSGWVDPFSP